jgi:hypothetical protein
MGVHFLRESKVLFRRYLIVRDKLPSPLASFVFKKDPLIVLIWWTIVFAKSAF